MAKTLVMETMEKEQNHRKNKSNTGLIAGVVIAVIVVVAIVVVVVIIIKKKKNAINISTEEAPAEEQV